MRKLWLLLAIGGLAAGCVGTGVDGETYVGVPGSRAWLDSASPATQRAYFLKRCQVYGHRDGSAEMNRCIQQEARSQRQVAEARAIAASSGSIYIPNDTPRAPQIQPWPQQQPQVVYQPAPGATLMNSGRNAYCTRMPGNC